MLPSNHILETANWYETVLREKSLPWIAIAVRGFVDAPLSFFPPSSKGSSFDQLISCDHVVVDDVSGENDYVLLFLPEKQFVLFVAAGAGDSFTTL